jgi:putative toxin-antitoxin system antitoxin component (TIGR02293 family)
LGRWYDWIVDVSASNPAVWKHALSVFGDARKAARWLATPLFELDGQTPEQALENDPKTDAVSAILDRIDYGVFS